MLLSRPASIKFNELTEQALNKVKNEVKIGLTIVIALLVAVIGFRLMQDVPLFRPSLQLYTYVDRADGINSGSSVVMSGVKIGTVSRVVLEGADSVRIVMNISFSGGIPVGSMAFVQPSDLLGGRNIRIVHSGLSELIPDGGFIPGAYDEGLMGELSAFAEDLKPDIQKTTGSLAATLEQIDELLREGGKENISQSLEAVSAATGELNRIIAASGGDLEQSIQSFRNLMANLDTLTAGREEQIESTLYHLEQTSERMSALSADLGGVATELNEMMQYINRGEGSVGKLVYDPSLYENLDSLAVGLNNLIRRIEEDPGHFLRHMRLVDIF